MKNTFVKICKDIKSTGCQLDYNIVNLCLNSATKSLNNQGERAPIAFEPKSTISIMYSHN